MLATGTDLHGALSVNEVSGNATLTYASGTPSLADWSPGKHTGSENDAPLGPQDLGGVLPRWDGPVPELMFWHRP